MIKRLGVAALVLLALASVVVIAFAKSYRIPGYSMAPNLRPGDRVLVLRFVGPIEPDKGDIAAYRVFRARCGPQGEAVFLHRITRRLRKDRFVLRGDNRHRSCDSSVLGPVARDDLIGQVVAVYWPPSRWGFR